MTRPISHICSLACGALIACQGLGCGYTIGSLHQNHVRTVAVPIFKTEALRRGIEYQLTEAVQDEIKNRTNYRIANEDEADTRLRGRIVRISKRRLGENKYDDPRELQYSLAVEVIWEDIRNGKVISQQTVPLKAAGVQFDANATFAPEVGQSQATANQTAIHKLAAEIVDRMEGQW